MQSYELMLVVQGQIPEDLAKEVINKVKSTISELGGKEGSEDFWGRRKLAYKIRSQEHGYYDVLNFSLEPEDIKKLESEIKLIGEIIRHLVIRKPEKVVAKPEKKKVVKKELPQKEELKEERKAPMPAPSGVGVPTDNIGKEPKEKVKVAEEKIDEKPKEEKEEKVKETKEEEFKKEKERLKELDKKIDEILKE